MSWMTILRMPGAAVILSDKGIRVLDHGQVGNAISNAISEAAITGQPRHKGPETLIF